MLMVRSKPPFLKGQTTFNAKVELIFGITRNISKNFQSAGTKGSMTFRGAR